MTTVTLLGAPITISGNLPAVNSLAPNFTVTKIDLGEISLKNYLGKKIILNIFPSLDTTTCATAMIHFNEIASQHKNVLVLCISADLPFAQKRFCVAEHLENVQPVSVFRHPQFGEDFGVTIKEGPLTGLLARSVVMLDEEGRVIYTELVDEISQEPNYAAITALLNS